MSTEKTEDFADTGMPLYRPGISTPVRERELRKAERLMEVYMRIGDIPAALRSANTLIRLDPASAAYHYNRALLCQHQSQIALAVHEFMQTIWLDPEGPYSDPARNFLEDLDMLQLSQIVMLAGDDLVFRTKLNRDCQAAAIERGFVLSPMGEYILQEYCEVDLAESPAPARASRYH